jgi:DNA-binding NarL/FixJ family response regulator
MSLPPRLRLLLVDDQPLFRKALASLINGQFDMTVVGEASNGSEAVAQIRALTPDLVVMDGSGATGIDGVREATLRDQDPDRHVDLGQDDDLFRGDQGRRQRLPAQEPEAGAALRLIRGAAKRAGDLAGDRQPSARRLRDGRAAQHFRPTEPGEGEMALTRRESEILRYVATGLSNKEIAGRLTITEGTVKNHVHHALEKLHLTNRVQAAAYAVRHRMGTEGGSGS